MSKAVICDRCGLILPVDGNFERLFTVNPRLYSGLPDEGEIDLCEECFDEFEREYMSNLRNEAGE